MNKRHFIQFLNQELKYLTMEEKVESILKIKNSTWLDDYLKHITKNYTLCPHCKKYSLTKKFKNMSEQEIEHNVCVHSDAGYGDNDEFATVTYRVFYEVCPKCGDKIESSRITLDISNRHSRFDN